MTFSFSSIIKRSIDIILSVIILTFALPASIIIILFLIFEHKSFPFLMQSRGLTLTNGKVSVIKFKTLLNEENFKTIEEQSNNIFYKPGMKKFVPPFSGWLRKTGLDELPQFLNVLSGKMSIVGPRPLTLRDLQLLKEKFPDSYNKRDTLTVKPGISGLWQLYGDRKKSASNLIELDFLYQQSHSFWTDLKIIMISIYLVITAGNSDAIMNNNIG